MNELNVIYRVGQGEYAIPADSVLHMESFEGATPVPGAPSYVVGIVQVRGRVIPVVDLRRRFGLPERERELADRVLVVEHEGREVGLLADSAREVMLIDQAAFAPPPSVASEANAALISGVAQVDGRFLLRIALGRLLGPSALSSGEHHGEQRDQR